MIRTRFAATATTVALLTGLAGPAQAAPAPSLLPGPVPTWYRGGYDPCTSLILWSPLASLVCRLAR